MHTVEKMCKVFKISSGAFYRWKNDPLGKVARRNGPVKKRIRQLFRQYKARYGSKRIAKELQVEGIQISRPTVAVMMKQMGLVSRQKRKFRITTDSKHNYRIVPNRLKRNFFASRKAQVWVSDITYIETSSGWLYLTVILDLFDRKVVGWSLSNRLTLKKTVLL